MSSYWCAIQLYRDTGHTGDEAQSLLTLGRVERQLGHLDQAQEAYLLAQKLFQSLHQIPALGRVALALGHTQMQRAHLEQAGQYYQEALSSFRTAASEGETDALSSLAKLQCLMGRFSEAQAALLAYTSYRYDLGIANAQRLLAEIATNHVAMVSHPDDVLKLIETAAQAVPVAH